jgi:2,4-dienoyl-CoA reductase-like NADH-dependent reductase (Old Yellow Enzyme family)
VLTQLAHFGKEMVSTGSLQPTLGFSQSPGHSFKEAPREMETEEIESFLNLFADYASGHKGGL